MAPSDEPGPEGTDPFDLDRSPRPFPITADGATPGPIGIDLKAGDRIIDKVIKDWDLAKLKTTEYEVHGKNAQEVGEALLKKGGEWGRGGGSITNDDPGVGTSTPVTVTIHGNLLKKMPKWSEYAQASARSKANWDAMIAKLDIHESKHVQNAVDAAEACAKELIGKEILQMPGIVTKHNAAMLTAQQTLDSKTQNGTKSGVPYGDVILNTDEDE